MEPLLVICPQAEENPRLSAVLSHALEGRPHVKVQRPDELHPVTGQRVLFAVSLLHGGVNLGWYAMLSAIRQDSRFFDGCCGAVLVDGDGELYTKSAAREIVFAANQAGCAFMGAPLVEATGSLENFHIRAMLRHTDYLGAYTACTRELVDRLLAQFGDDISVLPHDNYYAAHHDLSLEQRQTLNYDHPASFDTDRMIQDLQDLRAGKTIHCPVYDYAIHDRTEETRELKPNKVILVEGILIFENKTLRDLMDIKLFVDTDADVRILRRIVRDVKERGRSLDSVVEQYLATVKPMHEQFVEPSKRYADLIVPEGGNNQVAIDILTMYIKKHLGS